MPPEVFHPDLRRLARWLPRAAVGPRTVGVARFLTGLQSRSHPKDVAIRRLGPISVRLHEPPLTDDAPRPGLLWIHGGGYVLGSAAQDDAICRFLARRLGAVVAAVEYRMPPEHPFPVPLHDCHDALVWLAGLSSVDRDRVAIGGASAGGGLAAALALLARDRGEVKPVFQLLAYPMLDDRTALRTDVDERHFRLWNNKSNHFGWRSYTGHPPGSPEIDGLAAPARAEDLSGLPPAWLGVGTLDLFHDEDVEYVRRLNAAGVPCDLLEVPGAFHGFDSVAAKAGVTRDFRMAQAEALEKAFG